MYLFGCFWVFNSFINTNSRQCHRYRKHTNNSNSVVRMYIYDRPSKGNMLFLTDDRTLRMRDKYHREVTLFATDGSSPLFSMTAMLSTQSTGILNQSNTRIYRVGVNNDKAFATTPAAKSSPSTSNHSAVNTNDDDCVKIIRIFLQDLQPLIAESTMGFMEFFHCCREYMLRDIGYEMSFNANENSSANSSDIHNDNVFYISTLRKKCY